MEMQLKSGMGMVGLERVLKLRGDRGAFKWFLDNICAAVCGVKDTAKKKQWRNPVTG
jgi:hypothetical protein